MSIYLNICTGREWKIKDEPMSKAEEKKKKKREENANDCFCRTLENSQHRSSDDGRNRGVDNSLFLKKISPFVLTLAAGFLALVWFAFFLQWATKIRFF
jgi:hypothetical protein